MPLTKALIITTTPRGQVIPVMFNPPQYEITKTNEFAEIAIPGLGSSLLQFVKGNIQTLKLDLFFDTTDTRRDVRFFTSKVVGLTALSAVTHAPPVMLFIWGSLVFPCVLDSVTERFDYFGANGAPLRATLSVSLKGYDVIESLLSLVPFESADRTKRRVFKAGDSLQRIAAEEYDDPRKWRPIAQASNIDNPLTIPNGRGLTVPTLK
jgi:nucleoid-associated protein YgaU